MSCIISPNNRALVLVTEMEAKKRGSFQSPKITKKLTARIIKIKKQRNLRYMMNNPVSINLTQRKLLDINKGLDVWV